MESDDSSGADHSAVKRAINRSKNMAVKVEKEKIKQEKMKEESSEDEEADAEGSGSGSDDTADEKPEPDRRRSSSKISQPPKRDFIKDLSKQIFNKDELKPDGAGHISVLKKTI